MLTMFPFLHYLTERLFPMQELLEDMQAGDNRGGRGCAISARRSATSASPHSTQAEDQRRRLCELQTAVRDLDADNRRLKEGLAAARPATTSAPTSNGARDENPTILCCVLDCLQSTHWHAHHQQCA